MTDALALNRPPPPSSTELSIIWTAIVISLMTYVPIRLGDSGREISVSLFDGLIFLLCCWQFWRGRNVWHPILLYGGVIIVLLAATAAATIVFGETVQMTSLLRETVKYIGFVSGVTICGLLLRIGVLSAPSLRVIALLGLTILVIWALQATIFMSPQKNALVVNGYSNVALGLVVLSMHQLQGQTSKTAWFSLIAFVGTVLVMTVVLRGAAMGGVAFVVLIVIIIAAANDESINSPILRLLPYVLLIAGVLVAVMIAILLFNFIDQRPEFICSTDHTSFTDIVRHINEGVAIRISLWLKAFSQIGPSMPIGLGPGQFGSLGLTEIELLRSTGYETLDSFGINTDALKCVGILQLRFVHNTFIAMSLEWGIVGIALAITLLIVVLRTIQILWLPAAICYIAYLIPTLLLNDGLGFRVHYIILGLAIAHMFTDRAKTNVDVVT